MTPHEWLTTGDPQAMLAFLTGRADPRKLRLFACACCRRMAAAISYGPTGQALLAAEAQIDGEPTPHLEELSAQLEHASQAAQAVTHMVAAYDTTTDGVVRRAERTLGAARSLRRLLTSTPASAASLAHVVSLDTEHNAEHETARHAERRWQADALRDIFHPFHFLVVQPHWRTTDVLNLARAVYVQRDYAALPVLGDALEEAGCTDAEMLAHCRSPVVHVRGCWVVDALLEK